MLLFSAVQVLVVSSELLQ